MFVAELSLKSQHLPPQQLCATISSKVRFLISFWIHSKGQLSPFWVPDRVKTLDLCLGKPTVPSDFRKIRFSGFFGKPEGVLGRPWATRRAGGGIHAAMAAIRGLTPMMFITRVKL